MKIFLQELHKNKVPWDDEVSEELRKEWLKCLSEVEDLGVVEIVRCFESVNADDPVCES